MNAPPNGLKPFTIRVVRSKDDEGTTVTVLARTARDAGHAAIRQVRHDQGHTLALYAQVIR